MLLICRGGHAKLPRPHGEVAVPVIGFGVDPLKRHDAGEALKTGGVER